MSDFKRGDLVSHPEYGRGLVVDGRPFGGPVVVQFADDWWSLGSLDNLTLLATHDPARHQYLIDLSAVVRGGVGIAEVIRSLRSEMTWSGSTIADQIEAQATRREEPTDPAVRVKAGDYIWVRIGSLWTRGSGFTDWADLLVAHGPVEVIEP